ncbi:MAG: hypothetical protein AAFQ94_20350 [Bacteroidota bacterium]
MRVSVGVIILVLCAISSCRDKVVCPAYQSTYILDDSVRMTYYSYLWKLDEGERQNFLAKEKAKDSIPNTVSNTPSAEYFAYVEPYIPPVEKVNKNQYGIIKYQPFWIKNARLRTAPKVNVHKPVFDEEEFDQEGTFLAGDFAVTDSLGNVTDSTVVKIPLSLQGGDQNKKGPRYLYNYELNDQHNMEQVYYNKYFGEYLVDRRPPPQPDTLQNQVDLPDSLQKKKKGFFKNLFKKKNKAVSDSTAVDPELLEEDPVDEDENTEEGEGGND